MRTGAKKSIIYEQRFLGHKSLLLETNDCILLIAGYSLLRKLSHIRALEDSFHDVFHFVRQRKIEYRAE